MKGVYTASIKIAGLTTARTLMHITAPATRVLEILSAEVSNASNETNEQIECALQRISAAGVTPTEAAVTPAKHENGDQASVSTVKGNVTAGEPTYAADTEIGRAGAASLAGWRYDPTPEEREVVPPSGALGLRLLAAAAAFDAIVRITYREIG